MPSLCPGCCFPLGLPDVIHHQNRGCAVDEDSGAIHGGRPMADARAYVSAAAFEDAAGDAFRCADGPG
jgi:hypothetical protein